jgi:Uri superfamily endonuclease
MVLSPGLKKVQKIISSDRGIYILEFHSSRSFSIELKKFRNIRFKKGFYYYIGSAQKNLNSRIERHLKKDKKLHWHIDYITSLPFIKIFEIKILPDFSKEFECRVVNYINVNYEASFPAKKFGNSDCLNCHSHLIFSRNQFKFTREFDSIPVISCYPKEFPR